MYSIDNNKTTTQPTGTEPEKRRRIMRTEKYFEKNNKIYGVSSVHNFGWTHTVYVFNNLEDANKWLHKEEGNFAERELMSKSKAIQLAGKNAVENAMDWMFPTL